MPLAVITGASSGIGAVYTDRLARRGLDVLLVARDETRLAAVAEAIRARGGVAEYVGADLTDAAAIDALARRVETEPELEVLVNCAGHGGYGPFADRTPREVEALTTIHVHAVARLSHAAVRAMRPRDRGALINVASLLAFSAAMPGGRLADRALYAGGKAFIVTFTQTLARELEDTGIRVQACVPGIVDTPFSHGSGAAPPAHMVMAPEEVVDASLAALERREPVCVPGLEDERALERLGSLGLEIMLAGNQQQRAARYREAHA